MAFLTKSEKSNANKKPRNAENPVITYFTVCMLDDGTVVIKNPIPDKKIMIDMLDKAAKQLRAEESKTITTKSN